MHPSILELQNDLLSNRERISSLLKSYQGFLNVGVGVKEKNNVLTDIICYRVYVSRKLPKSQLLPNQLIPNQIDGFLIDVIERGNYEEIAADSSKQRPLKGGVQIKNDKFLGNNNRGVGTLGYIARLNDGSNKLVGLTCEHVVRLTPDETIIGREVGQPRKVVCCCCCTYNIIGKVLNAQKDANVDCAIIELDEDILEDINDNNSENEIVEIGEIRGTETVSGDDVLLNTIVQKRGAGTGLTEGTIIDIAFDGTQILIAPSAPHTKFADFGDSGAVVVNKDSKKILGLLWAAQRDGRAEGVANPIDAVLTAMNITIPSAPPITGTVSVDASDPDTHEFPSVLPPGPDVRQHFVTAKGSGDIILKATFDEVVDNDSISWLSVNPDAPLTFPAIGTDNSTAKISRNTTDGLHSTVALFARGELVKRISVWIVWSDGQNVIPGVIEHVTIAPNFTSVIAHYGTKTGDTFTTHAFEFTIKPEEIIPDSPTDDVPDLTGNRTTSPPDVSIGDTGVFQQGVDLAPGADKRWDVTRRLKLKVLNPSGVDLVGSAEFNTDALNYPSDPVVGNDDRGIKDEINDPYTNNKKISSGDRIETAIETTSGAVGDVVEYRIHFQEFARLELGGKWYNISDPIPWRHHVKFIKDAGPPVRWIDNGSDTALDNNGF